MLKITSELLRQHGACSVQLRQFIELGGDTKRHTKALYVRHASTFDWGWAAERLLTGAARKAYAEAKAPALKAYDEAAVAARKAYDEAIARAFWDATREEV